MKNVTKEEWVAALRSGDYKQGHSVLKFNDEFCCLGVLCDLSGGEWNKTSTKIDSFSESTSYPPYLIECASDLSFTTLASMNDNGKSFNEIADKIEVELADGTIFPFEELV